MKANGFLHFSFFHFIQTQHTSLFLPHTLPPVSTPHHHLHHLFQRDLLENSLEISKAFSSLLFKVKTSFFFLVDFYTFARDSLYLSFWSDNLVFMCIGFDLVDLFDKWVYIYKRWLSKVYLWWKFRGLDSIM